MERPNGSLRSLYQDLGLRRVSLILVVSLTVIVVLFFYNSDHISNVCEMHAIPSIKVKENPKTGEVVEKKIIGDWDCKNYFPDYYQDLSETEVKEYCSENNSSEFCSSNSTRVSPNHIRFP